MRIVTSSVVLACFLSMLVAAEAQAGSASVTIGAAVPDMRTIKVTLTCPASAVRGKTAPITVAYTATKTMSMTGGTLEFTLWEDDVLKDDKMDTWTDSLPANNTSKTFTRNINLGNYESTPTAEVYLTVRYKPQLGAWNSTKSTGVVKVPLKNK